MLRSLWLLCAAMFLSHNIYIYIYIYIYVYIYTCIYIYMYACVLNVFNARCSSFACIMHVVLCLSVRC